MPVYKVEFFKRPGIARGKNFPVCEKQKTCFHECTVANYKHTRGAKTYFCSSR